MDFPEDASTIVIGTDLFRRITPTAPWRMSRWRQLGGRAVQMETSPSEQSEVALREALRPGKAEVRRRLTMILLGQGWTSISKLQSMRTSSVDISDNWLPSVRVLGEIKYMATRHRVWVFRRNQAEDDATRQVVADKTTAILADMEQAFTKYELMIDGQEERALWTAFRSEWAEYLRAVEAVFQLKATGRVQEANKGFNDTIAAFDKAIGELDKDIALNNRGASTATELAKSTYDNAWFEIIILTTASLVLAVGSGLFVVFGVTRPLEILNAAMKAISGGNLATEIPSTSRRNEIGDMARTLVVFRDGLAETGRLRAEQAEKEAAVARRMVEERHKIADSFMSTMGTIATQFVKSSGEVADAARNLSAIRPQCITRKNALFAGSDGGGRTWATIASLLQTAKMNRVDPFAWLKLTLERLANGWPNSRIDELMPWNHQATA